MKPGFFGGKPDYDIALSHFKKAENAFCGNNNQLFDIKTYISEIYSAMGRKHLAAKNLKELAEISQNLRKPESVTVSYYDSASEYYLDNREYDNCISCILQAGILLQKLDCAGMIQRFDKAIEHIETFDRVTFSSKIFEKIVAVSLENLLFSECIGFIQRQTDLQSQNSIYKNRVFANFISLAILHLHLGEIAEVKKLLSTKKKVLGFKHSDEFELISEMVECFEEKDFGRLDEAMPKSAVLQLLIPQGISQLLFRSRKRMELERREELDFT